MRLFFLYLIFCIRLIYSPVIKAQTDSTFTDTVVIIKDPFVIRQEVVIRALHEPKRQKLPLILGFYFGLAKNHIISFQDPYVITGKITRHIGFQFGLSWKNLELTTGIGRMTAQVNYVLKRQIENILYRQEIKDVILDHWEEELADGSIVKHTITRTDTFETEHKQTFVLSEEFSYENRFLQIPFSISYSYKMFKNKLALVPGFQIILNSRLNDTESRLFAARKFSWFIAGHLKAEYNLKDNLSFEIKTFLQQCISNIYMYEHKEKWKIAGLTAGINYRFK